MKKSYIQIQLLFLLMFLLGVGCEKEPVGVPQPGVRIYKTRNDYYNNVHTYLNDGKAYFIQGLLGKVDEEPDGKLNYRLRARLCHGYILAAEEPLGTAFLKYTIEEYYNDQKKGIILSMDEIQASIIDADPFTEMYYDDSNFPKAFAMRDTARINEIILNGELEKYFKKEK